MKHSLALVACCAMVATPIALADGGQSTATATPTQSTESCTPLKQVYSERNWRESKPAQGQTVCPVSSRASGRNTVRHFYEYRHYRQIATMRCLPGREGYFVPNPGSCSTIQCESNFNWWAQNPSGALYIYQLLGHGAPPPSSFHNRLVNHEIAATLSRSSWVC